MAEEFLSLSSADRTEALGVATSASGRPAHILEKDIWVVWTLSALFESSFGKHLVFKGGTSLAKAYKAIRRFSEDIDITYDIRAFAPDLVESAGEDALPPNSSQEAKWSKTIRKKLPIWVSETALPLIQDRLSQSKYGAKARADKDCLYIDYEAHASGYGYVKPHILVEFGARSTGEPADVHNVVCDAAEFLSQLSFPRASPRVMRAERTFWEKATAIHVFCLQGQIRDRLARHWYDVAKLDATGYASDALKDRKTAQAVAHHKSWFFEAKDSEGKVVDYFTAVNGGLRLVPEGPALEALTADYARMIEDGLLLDDAEPLDSIIERCRSIQVRANEAYRM